MNTTITCESCAHYDAVHGMCPLFTVDLAVGEVYLKRAPESPVCSSKFVEKPAEKTLLEHINEEVELLKKILNSTSV